MSCTDVSGLDQEYRTNALSNNVCMPSDAKALTGQLQSLDYDVCSAIVGGEDVQNVYAFSDMARELNATVTVGAGYGGGVGVSASTEAGFMIGPNGEAGCYISQCIGGELDIQGSVYENLAIYSDWGDVPGRSLVITEGVSFPFVDAGYSTSQVISNDQLVGAVYTFNVGFGILPIDLSLMDCRTNVVQIRPTKKRWAEYWFEGSSTSDEDHYDHFSNWSPTGL